MSSLYQSSPVSNKDAVDHTSLIYQLLPALSNILFTNHLPLILQLNLSATPALELICHFTSSAMASQAINAKYESLGGSAGFLGPAQSQLVTDSSNGGFYITYKNGGLIYWTSATGAHVVYGAIYQEWIHGGGIKDIGYPITDELSTPDGVCRYNNFHNGRAIYWTPADGAHLIYGDIYKKWIAEGGERDVGYPITNELSTADHICRYNNFHGGRAIYWTSADGAHLIYGDIYKKWISFGGEGGGLGYPVTDETSTADHLCRYNNFKNGGSIYWRNGAGAFLVYGEIYRKWISLGGEGGFLGYPTTDELPTPGANGRYNDFRSGSIYWSAATGAHAVYGDIRARYLSLGGPASFLGFPTTDETDIPGATGRMQKFERGVISWYGSADSIVVSGGAKYNFSVDAITCNVTRSRSTDTIYIALSVAIAGRDPVQLTKNLGDHAEGTINPGAVLSNIAVADEEVAVFTYLIVNNGHQSEGEVRKAIEGAANKLATTGANAAAKAIETSAATAAGAAIGALIGSPVPVLGTIVGAGLGALTGALLGELIDVINPNCDGSLAAAAQTVTGVELREKTAAGQPFGHRDSNPGIDSPHGCGKNSDYNTTWSISKAN